jgi:hypothetical protein
MLSPPCPTSHASDTLASGVDYSPNRACNYTISLWTVAYEAGEIEAVHDSKVAIMKRSLLAFALLLLAAPLAFANQGPPPKPKPATTTDVSVSVAAVAGAAGAVLAGLWISRRIKP